MTAQRSPSREVAVSVENDPEGLKALEERLADDARHFEYEEAAVFALRLSLREAISNAFRHGHAELPAASIDVKWTINEDEASMVVRDQGPGFNPDDLPDPTHPENLTRPGGRGVMLIRAYMTDVEFNDRGNELRMRFEKP